MGDMIEKILMLLLIIGKKAKPVFYLSLLNFTLEPVCKLISLRLKVTRVQPHTMEPKLTTYSHNRGQPKPVLR